MEIHGTQLLSHSVAVVTGKSVLSDRDQGNDDHGTTSRRGQSVEAKSGAVGAIWPGLLRPRHDGDHDRSVCGCVCYSP